MCYSQTEHNNKESSKWYGITGALGVSTFKETLTPFIKVDARILQPKKYKLRLGTTINYFFSENNDESKMYRNVFVQTEYLKHHRNEDYFGIGIAYLLDSHGNFYTKETFRLAFIKSLSFVELKGELTFNMNFEQMFPGIGISFGLN